MVTGRGGWKYPEISEATERITVNSLPHTGDYMDAQEQKILHINHLYEL